MPRVRVSPLGPKMQEWLLPCLHFSFEGETRKSKCNCPAGSCLPPARRRQHLNLSSLPTRTICSSWVEIRKSKCNCPVGSCWSPAGWRPHLNLSNLATRTICSSWVEIRKSKCNCPVGSCLPPARRRQLLNLSSLPTRTNTGGFIMPSFPVILCCIFSALRQTLYPKER